MKFRQRILLSGTTTVDVHGLLCMMMDLDMVTMQSNLVYNNWTLGHMINVCMYDSLTCKVALLIHQGQSECTFVRAW